MPRDTSEMDRWAALSEAERSMCSEQARRILVSSKRWSSQVRQASGIVQRDGRNVSALYAANEPLYQRIDNAMARGVEALRGRVEDPVVPLYIAVWNEAMGIEASELDGQSESAVVLSMVRVQDTAHKLVKFNHAPTDKALQADLAARGITRR